LPVTANTHAGAYLVKARVEGVDASADFNLTSSADKANSSNVISGSDQVVTVGASFDKPLVAQVLDANQNPVPNVTVSYVVPDGSGAGVNAVSDTKTDEKGMAYLPVTANTHAGVDLVKARVEGVDASADFNLTNSADKANSINVISGSDQVITVGASFDKPLV